MKTTTARKISENNKSNKQWRHEHKIKENTAVKGYADLHSNPKPNPNPNLEDLILHPTRLPKGKTNLQGELERYLNSLTSLATRASIPLGLPVLREENYQHANYGKEQQWGYGRCADPTTPA